MRPILSGLALLISVGASTGVVAGERFRVIGPYGYGGGYGFADEAIGGAYIGAPLTRFPRPNEIVPPAWGYGTYGVPTITGIRQAPIAAPTLTVIRGTEVAPRRRAGSARFVSRNSDGVEGTGQNGVRVISVTVPRN